MSKRGIFLGILFIAIVIAGSLLGIQIYKSQKTTPQESSQNTSLTSMATPSGEFTTYQDESGFSFEYPNSMQIKDVTPDDNVYYSKLELSQNDQKITISMYDTKFKSVSDWIKDSQSTYSSFNLLGAETLDKIPVSKYSGEINGKSVLITAGIDQGVLYLIEGPSSLEQIQDNIISSFKIGSQQAAQSNSNSQDSNTIYESEEVVQ